MSRRIQLKWKSYYDDIKSLFCKLRSAEEFTDIVVSNGDKSIKCHRVILSSACRHFYDLLKEYSAGSDVIVYVGGVDTEDMLALVEFMYSGVVEVAQPRLHEFLTLAKEWGVRGLGADGTAARRTQMSTGSKRAREESSDDSSSEETDEETPASAVTSAAKRVPVAASASKLSVSKSKKSTGSSVTVVPLTSQQAVETTAATAKPSARKKTKHQTTAREHTKENLPDIFACPHCPRVFLKPHYFVEHNKKMHADSSPLEQHRVTLSKDIETTKTGKTISIGLPKQPPAMKNGAMASKSAATAAAAVTKSITVTKVEPKVSSSSDSSDSSDSEDAAPAAAAAVVKKTVPAHKPGKPAAKAAESSSSSDSSDSSDEEETVVKKEPAAEPSPTVQTKSGPAKKKKSANDATMHAVTVKPEPVSPQRMSAYHRTGSTDDDASKGRAAGGASAMPPLPQRLEPPDSAPAGGAPFIYPPSSQVTSYPLPQVPPFLPPAFARYPPPPLSAQYAAPRPVSPFGAPQPTYVGSMPTMSHTIPVVVGGVSSDHGARWRPYDNDPGPASRTKHGYDTGSSADVRPGRAEFHQRPSHSDSRHHPMQEVDGKAFKTPTAPARARRDSEGAAPSDRELTVGERNRRKAMQARRAEDKLRAKLQRFPPPPPPGTANKITFDDEGRPERPRSGGSLSDRSPEVSRDVSWHQQGTGGGKWSGPPSASRQPSAGGRHDFTAASDTEAVRGRGGRGMRGRGRGVSRGTGRGATRAGSEPRQQHRSPERGRGEKKKKQNHQAT